MKYETLLRWHIHTIEAETTDSGGPFPDGGTLQSALKHIYLLFVLFSDPVV